MTTKIKHTPDPWTADLNEGMILSKCINEYGNFIVTHIARDLTNEDKSNVQLMAAAPELLEACKIALSEGDELTSIRALQAAISKAEGNQ